MKVSNPDRVVFPADGITKGEVVDHYRVVAGVMLAHLEGRPLTLQRFPRGIEEEGFMQKNASKHFPASIRRVEVPKEGGTTLHAVCDTEDDLLYLANQGTLAFHIWTSRLPHLDRPDRLVLDLDPATGSPPPRDAARAAGKAMEEVGLSPGLMTTGSKGYHVVARIDPHHDYATVAHASRLLAGTVAARHPEVLTTEFLKSERRDRVFVDWLRNRWAQSVISPWSLRPRDGAPVATPISWDELDRTDPTAWRLENIQQRVVLDDPWPGPALLDVGAIDALAEEHQIRADEPFDRFGRRR